MPKDNAETITKANWEIEKEPETIKPDSWCVGMVPIRKIFHPKQVPKQEATKNTSKPTRSLQGIKLKKSLNKETIAEDEDEEEVMEAKPIPIEEDNNRNSVHNKNKGNKPKKTKKPIKQETSNQHIQNKTTQNKKNMTKQNSRRKLKVQKFNPNKPFTFDHDGSTINIVTIKPDKIFNNVVECNIEVEETNDDSKNSQKEKLITKKQKKKRNQKSVQPTHKMDQWVKKTVPVQPPIETILNPSTGVKLKTKTGIIKGQERNKKNVKNLTRNQYNEFIKQLQTNTIPKQIFDTTEEDETKPTTNSTAQMPKQDDTEKKTYLVPVSMKRHERKSIPSSPISMRNRLDPSTIAVTPNRLLSNRNNENLLVNTSKSQNIGKTYRNKFKVISTASKIEKFDVSDKIFNDK